MCSLNTALHTATVGNTKALRASTVAEAKPVSVGRSVGRSFCWRLHANREFLEKHQAGRRHVGERVILNSPWNTQVDDMRPPVSDNADTASWNNYPLDAEEQLRSLRNESG